MAAADFITYDAMWKNALAGNAVFSTASSEFGCWVLLTSDYTPDKNVHATSTNLTNELSTATDYERQLVQGLTVTTGSTQHVVTVDCADVAFGDPITITAKYMVMVNSQSAGINPIGTDPLIGYIDLNSGGNGVTATNGSFDVTINAGGLFDVRQST